MVFGFAVMAEMVFPKPLVTIPPLLLVPQRERTQKAMVLMSSGSIKKWSMVSADWPDVWKKISHMPGELSGLGGFGLIGGSRGC